MGIDVKAGDSGFKGYLLVRDKYGVPKFDDIFDIDEVFWNVLTEEEKNNIKKQRQEQT